jgi:hypothetical protein
MIVCRMSGVAVGGDRHPHPRRQLRVERVGFQRMVERVADGRPGVGQPLDGRLGVDDPRPDGQILQQQILAGKEDARRGVAVDVDDLIVFLVAGYWPAQNLGSAFSHRKSHG